MLAAASVVLRVVVFGAIVLGAVVLGAVAPVFAPAASAAPADTIYSLVNQARATAGLRGFLHNPDMDAVAAAWAEQMGAAGVMSHNPQFSAQIPGGWTRAGENVAEGYPTPQAMFDGWMKSPGHRANILGDYTDVGIAFVSLNGRTWGVQDFGKYPGHVGPAAPPPPVAPPVAAPAPVPAPVPAATAASDPSPTPPLSPSASPSSRPHPTASPMIAGESGNSPTGVDFRGNGVFGALLLSVAVVLTALSLTLVLWRRYGRDPAR